ncbi:MAG: hydrogenase maturation protein [Xanthomonadales bacterium]|nr:hydrogenase maturation protein [Xanthomonadales bacterium]
MRILLLCHSFNSLSQRLFVLLGELGHELSVEFDVNDGVTLEAVELFQPDLVVAPFLKRAIPEAVWSRYTCLVVHPGIVGDRGPSALDWAILNGERRWGVTVLQANAEMDGGDIWATHEFDMRDASKASLYRNEVTDAAASAVVEAIEKIQSGSFRPTPLDPARARGIKRPLVTQQDRAIDWQRDDTAMVLKKIRSADGFPGLRDEIAGREVFLYDASPAPGWSGEPGLLLARSGGAVCRATVDGAVWIGHLKDKGSVHPFKLPATQVLAGPAGELPQVSTSAEFGCGVIRYEEKDQVGYLHFPFYNGAMSTRQCESLRRAFLAARGRDTRVIVLMGGPDFWSNGMHLNVIEAASSAADESWRNINAIDDLAREIIQTTSHLTVSALRGNAGAGGVFLARAADRVIARQGVILNPHYKDMGNLYGSEYWTYLLPRCAGQEQADRIARARLPMGVREGQSRGLVDEWFDQDARQFERTIVEQAGALADAPDFAERLQEKARRRRRDEAEKPLSAYRDEELARMKLNFYGFDPSYHVARYNFVYKVPKSRTPLTIARHRRSDSETALRNVS